MNDSQPKLSTMQIRVEGTLACLLLSAMDGGLPQKKAKAILTTLRGPLGQLNHDQLEQLCVGVFTAVSTPEKKLNAVFMGAVKSPRQASIIELPTNPPAHPYN